MAERNLITETEAETTTEAGENPEIGGEQAAETVEKEAPKQEGTPKKGSFTEKAQRLAWMDQLGGERKADEAFFGLSLNDVYDELKERRAKDDRALVLDPDAPDEEKQAAIRKFLGTPEKAEDYKLPEWMIKTLPKEGQKQMQEWMLANNLTPTQTEAVTGLLQQAIQGQADQRNAAGEARFQEARKFFEGVWGKGDAFTAGYGTFEEGMKWAGGDKFAELKKALTESGAANYIPVIQAFHRIGAAIKEDPLIGKRHTTPKPRIKGQFQYASMAVDEK